MLERLSRDDLVQIVDVSHACVDVRSLADLRAVLDRVASMTSFTRIAVGTVRPGPDGVLEHWVNHSFGAAWEELYVGRGLYRSDGILEHARHVRGTFRWREVRITSGECATAAADHGLVRGVTDTHDHGPDAPLTMISAAAPGDGDSDRTVALVAAVAPHIHEAYARIRGKDAGVPARARAVALTDREREVLAWLQDGKTYWEIGLILGISERTVKYHFARLRTKLDATNRSHAVAKALRLGLLDAG